MARDQKWYEDEFWSWIPTEFTYSDKWNKRSKIYIPTVPITRDISYGSSPTEVLDVFNSVPEKQNAPVLIFIHGGYWTWMDKNDYAFSLEPIRAAGAIVVSINHTLCPAAGIDEIVEQVRQACAYVYSNIEEHGGDAQNMHVTGHSAGGHLTAMIAATDWKVVDPSLPENLIKSAVPSSGIFNMNSMRLTPQLNEYLKLDEISANRSSPIFLEPTYNLPMSVVVGADESEGFIAESKEFYETWSKKLTEIRYFEIPDVHHFSIIENMVNANDPFTNILLEHLGLSASS